MSDDSFKIICHRCRAAVPADVEVCPECGNVLISRPAPPPPASVAAPVAEAGASASAAGSAYVAVPDTDLGELYRQIAAGRPPSVSAASYAGFWTRFIAWMI